APALDTILKYSRGFTGAYANGGGRPAPDGAGWEHDQSRVSIDKFVSTALKWREKDPERVKLLGGCCGASPAYIGALNEALHAETSRVPAPIRHSGIPISAHL
ncbi:MAG: homocysteine S-methyltransferase family protein, partial [Pseudomonadota bacterium]|nr:homocysteine S-methyltransferase family protein [Pseudomonadota bacterium]